MKKTICAGKIWILGPKSKKRQILSQRHSKRPVHVLRYARKSQDQSNKITTNWFHTFLSFNNAQIMPLKKCKSLIWLPFFKFNF